MFLFFEAFGWMELLFIAAFAILLVLGTAFDRQGRESPKWYILGIGFVAVAVYYWKSWTFGSLWAELLTWQFWKPFVYYFGIGLLYSGLEFWLDIRRAARFFKDDWNTYLSDTKPVPVLDEDGKVKMETVTDKNGIAVDFKPVTKRITLREMFAMARREGSETKLFTDVVELTKDYVRSRSSESTRYRQLQSSKIVGVKLNPEVPIEVLPHVDRLQLAEHIGAWTLFWPFYLISLVIGDFLTGLFRMLANLFSFIASRFVHLSFRNVFKF